MVADRIKIAHNSSSLMRGTNFFQRTVFKAIKLGGGGHLLKTRETCENIAQGENIFEFWTVGNFWALIDYMDMKGEITGTLNLALRTANFCRLQPHSKPDSGSELPLRATSTPHPWFYEHRYIMLGSTVKRLTILDSANGVVEYSWIAALNCFPYNSDSWFSGQNWTFVGCWTCLTAKLSVTL